MQVRLQDKIFISYRRTDGDMVGRISDRLTSHFGIDSVFLDVDNIPVGSDFREAIDEAIDRSACVIIAIGKGWLQAANYSTDSQEGLESEADFVRIEVKSALERDVPIIPVLLAGAEMPGPELLPEDIRKLAFLNATSVRSGRDFRQDIEFLINSVKGILHPSAHSPSILPDLHNETTLHQITTGTSVQFSSRSLIEVPHSLKNALVGRYRLTEYVASGGGGAVYRAIDRNTQRQVCLKIAFPVEMSRDNLKSVVARGIEGLVQMAHPGIASIFDFDSFSLQDGKHSFFLAMEFLEGENVEKWLAKLPENQRLEKGLLCMKEIALILRDAHQFLYISEYGIEVVGVLHGDIKPNNIIMIGDKPKLLDFMLVDVQQLQSPDLRERRENDDACTMAFGTPRFMAPEQVNNGVLSRKTDIYSFGEMLKLLFGSGSRFSEPSTARENKAVLEQLADLSRACTEHNPSDRPQSMDIVVENLSRICVDVSDGSSSGGQVPLGTNIRTVSSSQKAKGASVINYIKSLFTKE